MSKKTKKNAENKEIIKRGRRKGEKPDTVILFNRHNCLFYQTIKNEDGKVIGRDYSIHDDRVQKLQIAFTRAQDTKTTKLMKAVRDNEYKEDIFKALPNFFDYTKTVDLRELPPQLFENEDGKIIEVVDKKAALEALDRTIATARVYLAELGMDALAEQLQVEYDKMLIEDTPIGKTEKQRHQVVQRKQLKLFKF